MVAASSDPALVAPGRWTESLSRLEAATESSMPNVQTVVIHKRKPLPLPAWVVTFTFLVSLLRQGNLMAELAQRCAIPRQGGYGGFDLLIAGLAFFSAPQTGGIKGFARAILGLSSRVAEIAGLKKLPSPASLSRLLAVADRLERADEFVGWLWAQGCACRDLLRSQLVQALDACGCFWTVLDFDPTVTAQRLRALPEGDDLPPARRRSAKTCAPGHTGRKRGQTQFSTAMLSHAGAGLWLHATVWAGNTPCAEAIGIAAAAIVRLVAWAGLDLDRTLLRFDGAGGNHPSIAAVAAHSLPYLTRLGRCHVLNKLDVMAYLSTAAWVAVADSGSGPRRHAPRRSAQFCHATVACGRLRPAAKSAAARRAIRR